MMIRMANMKPFLGAALTLLTGAGLVLAKDKDPLAAWRSGVETRPVLAGDAASHSIHTYYTTCPESPDGRRVLFFRSESPDAQVGEVCVVDRETSEVQVLARHVETEDAHRAACQQWTLGGKMVVFHEYRDDQWRVAIVDLETGEKRELAAGRQIGFCQPDGEVVPLYGPHGAPGEYRHFELLNVRSGKITTAVSVDTVRPAWAGTGSAGYLDEQLGDRPLSICFPMVSPDGTRAFFKLATPGECRDFRSPQFSRRLGVFFYDLEARKYLYLHSKWGHPAWHPDSRRIINMWGNGPVLLNIESGAVEQQIPMPDTMNSVGHPSMSPEGDLFVTDVQMSADRSRWGVALGDFRNGAWHLLREFDDSKGATSWRKNHPHPVFTSDGKRIYFNVNSEKWTRLYVAERRAE